MYRPSLLGTAEDPCDVGDDTTLTTVVDLTDHHKPMLRRGSSLLITQPVIAETTSTMKPLPLVAGDQFARPLFLKDRSMTMHDRIASPTLPTPTTHHQSKASTFLAQLLETSRSAPVPYDGKSVPASNQQATVVSVSNVLTTSTVNVSQGETSDVSLVPQRRRRTVVIRDSHVSQLSRFQHQNTMPVLLPKGGLPLQSIISGMTQLAIQREDEQDDYVTDTELHDRPHTQLAQDLSLYKKKSGTLLRILNELQRRLHDAEVESVEGRSDHIAMCRDLVDENILTGVVLVLREFRFHVALQIAAIELLSFLAEVSDLYAFMMAELDVEPLVQKIAVVHVSQERLVMDSNSLIQTISESKHKSHVVKMHKARQIEQEKKRAATFVKAFVAERKNSKLRGLEGLGGRCDIPGPRNGHHPPGLRKSSPFRGSLLSRELGVPPNLTAHYDLKVSFSKPRSNLMSSLETAERVFGEKNLELDSEILWRRPKTSPDPRRLKDPYSTTELAAVYLATPTFVAPSPMGKRMKRSTHSAMVPIHKTKRRGKNELLAMRDSRDYFDPTSTGHVRSTTSVQGNSVESSRSEGDVFVQTSCRDNEIACTEICQTHGCGPSGEDTDYDDEQFANDDEDGNGDKEGSEFAEANGDRLLPVGSDSDLFELVDRSGTDLKVHHESGHVDSDCLKGVGAQALSMTGSEQMCTTRTCAVSASPICSPGHAAGDTSELVCLLGSCIYPDDPTASPLAVGNSLMQSVSPAKRRPKKTTAACRTSPPASMLSNINVRPVSRRILAKAVMTTRRQRIPCSSSEKTERLPQDPQAVLATTQIATMLDSLRYQAEQLVGVTESDQPSSPSTNASVGFPHSPSASLTPTTSVAHIQALYARGLQHHKANELDAAVRCYEEGIHLQRSSGVQREFASLYINLGSARMAQERPYDALSAFSQAERIQPSNVKAKFNCGLVLMQLLQWEVAITKFREVVAADPTHVRAQCGLEQCRIVIAQARNSCKGKAQDTLSTHQTHESSA